MSQNKVLLIDKHFGVDIPYKFVQHNDMKKWNLHNHMEAVEIVRKGIHNEAYWDAWQEILTYAVQTIDGVDYWLDHSDSLYAIKYIYEELEPTILDKIDEKKHA